MEAKKVPVSVYAESTPNPAVLKFVANKRLIEIDNIEFKNIEEAKASPLATRLFHYPFIKEVFISSNYLALTKYDIVEWEDVTLEIREMVRDHLASGKEVLTTVSANSVPENTPESSTLSSSIHPEEKLSSDWTDMDHKINSLLDEYVRPAVEQDGGNIKFLNYDAGTVKVLLQGACSGCPSSTMTLKQGIQNLLNQMLPGQIKTVEAVNG